MMIKRLLVFVGLVMVFTYLLMPMTQAQNDSSAICADIQELIERNETPYDFGINNELGGGTLESNITRIIESTTYADFWSFEFTRPENEFGTVLNDILQLTFEVSASIDLEIAVFLQNTPIPTIDGAMGYQPMTDIAEYAYELSIEGSYVVVVRHRNIAEIRRDGRYEIDANFESGADFQPVTLRESIRDEGVSQSINPQNPESGGGYQEVTVAGITALTHPNALSSVTTQGESGARFNYPSGEGIFVNMATADRVMLLGGDLAVTRGDEADRRVFYLANYDYSTSTGNVNGDLTNITGADGTAITLNWTVLRGVWIGVRCAGFKHENGTTFITPIVRGENNALTFRSGQVPDDFVISVVSPRIERTEQVPRRHTINLNWDGIQPDSPMTLFDGVFAVELIGDRHLRLKSTDISMARQPDTTAIIAPPPENVPLAVVLDDLNATLLIDWVDLSQVEVIDTTLALTFFDRRGSVERNAVNLRRLEATDATIHTIYGDESGEQRLWLNADYGFIELITPAGDVPYNSVSQPGERGYIAHGQNHVGGECYPVNTALEDANCPPNGHINPANGNLWYAVTDLQAYGGLLDLTLTRNYNSRLSGVDGLFGNGWTGLYLLDYNVAYDVSAGARVVSAEVARNYPVGLNVIYAPRGAVTFTAGSGTQHTFYALTDDYRGGEQTLTALTMPGWTLTRADVRSNWSLRQNNGLVYHFDPAGRLLSYGYPDHGRVIEIDYPRDSLMGPAGLGSDPAIITDAPENRQLELYYDDQHRLTRSVLRSLSSDLNTLETRYAYDGRNLIGVTYADGETATYTYDERLIAHDDPRAPIATQMRYVHDQDGGVRAAFIDMSDTPESALLWRFRETETSFDALNQPDTLQVTMRGDEYPSHTYTYDLAVTGNITERDVYTLSSQSLTPLDDDESITPTTYIWENGLLAEELRRGNELTERNPIDYEYTPDGVLRGVLGGYPRFDATFRDDRLIGVTFADETNIALVYDERGLVDTYTTRQGDTLTYTWNAQNRPASITGTDGVTTTYTYNALGQVATVARGDYTLRYVYDDFGRLTLVDDPLTGAYTISYPTLRGINVTDVTGATSISRFDARGRLIETRLVAPDSPADTFLRRMTYEYDAQDRLTAESRWLTFTDDDNNLDERAITTRYSYTYRRYDFSTETLPTVAFDDLRPETETVNIAGNPIDLQIVNGYEIAVMPPAQITVSVYDAQDRIRQVIDPFQQVTRYDYVADDEITVGGLWITQRDVRPADDLLTAYVFDGDWQLRLVEQSVAGEVQQSWRLNRNGNNVTLNSIDYNGDNTNWSAYTAGRPTIVTAELQVADFGTNSTIRSPEYGLEVIYDVQGRATALRDGAGNVYRTAYCPMADGGTRVAQAVFAADPENPVTDNALCDSADHIMTYDAAGRVVAVQDTNGTRTYSYEPGAGEWLVTMTVDDSHTWELRYNSAGDLIRWRDENGIRRDYTYDTLGRLTELVTFSADDARQDDASYTFTYNDGDLLTAMIDNLGRGTFYGYDLRDQLSSVQDASNGNLTIYGYTSAGQLSSIRSPLGSLTTFSYDPAFSTRITGVTDATGSPTRYRWDTDNNRLITTDPRNRTIAYTFDLSGALWYIDNVDGVTSLRDYVFEYDAAGRLTAWDRVTADDTPDYTLDYADPQTVTVAGDTWSRTLETNLYNQLTGYDALDFDYDSFGRLTTIAAVDRATNEERLWQVMYSVGAQQITVTDGFDNQFDLIYDALNRLVQVDNGTVVTRYDYAPGGGDDLILNVSQNGESTGRSVIFSPGDTSANDPRVILRAPGQERIYIYNQENLLIEIRTEICLTSVSLEFCRDEDPDSIRRTSERFLYDTLGRPIRYIDPQENIATVAYDDTGNVVNYQNFAGQTFTYVYDTFDRLVELLGPTGIRLLLAYDDGDNVIGICRTRAERNITYDDCESTANSDGFLVETYDYDTLGRLVAQRFPAEDGEITYSYAEGEGLLSAWQVPERDGVIFEHSNDGLDLLSGYTIGGVGRFAMRYAALSQLMSVTSRDYDIFYTYDAEGRVTEITAGERTLRYDYDDNGRGYTISDPTGDAALQVSLNESGLISEIDASANVTINYGINRNNRNLVATITWSNGELLEMNINRDGSTGSVVYLQNLNLLVNYDDLATGQTQSGALIGSQSLFAEETSGYFTRIGYDTDGRPTNMSLVERTEGNPLYLLNFSYDGEGRRDLETREFQNNDQVTIDYVYDDFGRLEAREFTVTRPRTRLENGLPLLLLFPLFGWSLRGSSRRRLMVVIMAAGLVSAIFDGFTYAQQVGRFSQTYTYDTVGNMTSISYVPGDDTEPVVECIAFTYDAANRLTEVINAQGDNQTYDYDVYNRLIRAGDTRFAYIGDSDTLMARFDDDGYTVYGHTANRAGFFLAGDAGTEWLITDGRRDILTTTTDDAKPDNSIQLYDPLGRPVNLDATNIDEEANCGMMSNFDDSDFVQTLEPGMILDTQTNLYFEDGRAYSPQIGVYLQRDPLGPDVFGNVYAYPTRQAQPPVRERAPQYTNGLYRLEAAYDAIAETQSLTAQHVLAEHLPTWQDLDVMPLPDDLRTIADITQAELREQSIFPQWVMNAYNLPSAYLDDGMVRLVRDNAPGQARDEIVNLPDLHPFPTPDLLPQIVPPMSRLSALIETRDPQEHFYVTYAPFMWHPESIRVDSIAVPQPDQDVMRTPASVLTWLPQSLSQPQTAAVTLRASEAINALLHQPGSYWVESALADALPALPDLPPETATEWLGNWFTYDTLGVARPLSARYPDLPDLNVPVYTLGENPHWFRLD